MLAGLAWLVGGGREGAVAIALAVLPGALLLGGGIASLALPGDFRSSQITALGGALGICLALPVLLVANTAWGLLVLLASALGFLAAGGLALAREPASEDVPDFAIDTRFAAYAGLDEALLGAMWLVQPRPKVETLSDVAREVERIEELLGSTGWSDDPAAFHAAPPALQEAELRPARAAGIEFEHLCFESKYEPHPDLPGRERWLGYSANHTAHAWVQRHSGAPRPWLLCIPGYGAGQPWLDLRSFRSRWLHDELGFNVAVAVLPVHGPRAPGRRSGEAFTDRALTNLLYAEGQAIWDLRRLLSWIRAQGGGPIGVHGVSLGGYTAALLAGLEPGLACVVAGIPPIDLTRTMRRYETGLDALVGDQIGFGWDRVEHVLRVVSPLALEPRVPRERLFIYAATGDRFVATSQVRDLWRHWQEPRIAWLPCGHISMLWRREVNVFLREALEQHLRA